MTTDSGWGVSRDPDFSSCDGILMSFGRHCSWRSMVDIEKTVAEENRRKEKREMGRKVEKPKREYE